MKSLPSSPLSQWSHHPLALLEEEVWGPSDWGHNVGVQWVDAIHYGGRQDRVGPAWSSSLQLPTSGSLCPLHCYQNPGSGTQGLREEPPVPSQPLYAGLLGEKKFHIIQCKALCYTPESGHGLEQGVSCLGPQRGHHWFPHRDASERES